MKCVHCNEKTSAAELNWLGLCSKCEEYRRADFLQAWEYADPISLPVGIGRKALVDAIWNALCKKYHCEVL